MTLHDAAGDQLTAAQLYGLLRLRVDVFVVEQDCPYSELDGLDLRADTRHHWWQPDGGADPLACLRVLTEDTGYRIGRVCTAASARGRGLAGRLLAAALDGVVGHADAVLHAQVQAQGLYARFGFQPEGEPFDEDGIPHVRMVRPASAALR